jgi:hypothetical protein
MEDDMKRIGFERNVAVVGTLFRLKDRAQFKRGGKRCFPFALASVKRMAVWLSFTVMTCGRPVMPTIEANAAAIYILVERVDFMVCLHQRLVFH